MEVIINGRKTETEASNLEELMLATGPETGGIAVAVGTAVVPRPKWAETPLQEGAHITIIRATCGG